MQYCCQLKTYSFAVYTAILEGCAVTVAAGTRVVDTYVTRLRTRRARVDGTATLALRSENVQLAFNCGWGREGVTEQGIYR